MKYNWNSIWRLIHLSLGLILVVYHARIASTQRPTNDALSVFSRC